MRFLKEINDLDLPAKIKRAILGDNAEKLLGII
jgi:predicted TIM-barrel fold metal-dependent hydrolase